MQTTYSRPNVQMLLLTWATKDIVLDDDPVATSLLGPFLSEVPTSDTESVGHTPVEDDVEVTPILVVKDEVYFVTIRPRSQFKRLHCCRHCPLRPGVDKYEFVALGMALPPAASYNEACLRCFPGGPELTDGSMSGESSESDSDE